MLLTLFLSAWPAPDGWTTETIPFPLGFAPMLAHKGVEHLRFAPGMFKPGADDFFSYAFVWLIEKDDRIDPVQELPMYFDGLCKAVDAKVCKPSRAEIGVVEIVDAFKTKRPLRLNFDVQTRTCGTQQAVLFRLSPQPRSHAVWKSLGAVIAAFGC